MATIRVARRARFTTIDRQAVADERISFKAKGLLLWLLDKPDDWSVRSEDIARVGPDGRDAVRAGLTELEQAGYISREKLRQPDGTFVSVCTVYETPGRTGDGFPGAGETDGGSPDAGEPGLSMKTDTEDCDRRESSTLATRPRNELWDALVECISEPRTRPELSRRGKCVKELKEVGATAADVHIRCLRYKMRWPKVSLTDTALVAHWSELERDEVALPQLSQGGQAWMRSRQRSLARRQQEAQS